MEGALRNLVQKKVLCLCCGAFSDKWINVAERNGYEADKLQVEWGEAIDPGAVRAKLAEGGFDTVTFVHSETSTGVLNDLDGVAAVVKEFPDTMLVVDTVSSLSTVPTPMDELGIDVMIAGVQKALALPPGLAVFAVSEAALERAGDTPNRGYYFDFLEFEKNAVKNNTPSTPSIALLFGLQHMLGRSPKEGMDRPPRPPRRDQRHGPRLGRQARLRTLRARRPALQGPDLLQDPEGLRPPAFIKSLKERSTTSPSTAATARSRASPSASPTWATKPSPPCRNSSMPWMMCCSGSGPQARS
jgi:hypothetical protein